MLAQEVEELLTADRFNDQAGDDVVGVGVLPLRAGFEVERLGRPLVEDLARSYRLELRFDGVVFRRVILVAGSVGQDLPDRDFVAARQARHVLADRIIERELALFLKKKDSGGGKLFRD